jgi:hypothetical protein
MELRFAKEQTRHVENMGITVFGCEKDEADVFHEISRFLALCLLLLAGLFHLAM